MTVIFQPPQLSVTEIPGAMPVSTGNPIIRELAEGSLPLGGNAGDIIIKRTSADFDAEWVAPATAAEQDNTLPITAGAVYTEIGNINALLATI